MSYARYSEGDVYVWPSDGGIVCSGCKLMPVISPTPLGQPFKPDDEARLDFTAKDRAEMLEHLCEHKLAGDAVPDHALERLKQEIAAGEP